MSSAELVVLKGLPRWWGEAKPEIVSGWTAAYGQIMGEKSRNWTLLQRMREVTRERLQEQCAQAGMTAPPFVWDAIMKRIDRPVIAGLATKHLQVVEAFFTDYSHRLWEHITYRLANEGNVHLEFTGPTGMGKSSCALGLADRIKPIHAQSVTEHLCFDLGELPGKLARVEQGHTVIQDEYVEAGGEGAITAKKMVQNLEDTLRASQKNLFMCSPRRQEHGAMQAVLELVFWNTRHHYSVFLCWLEDVPHGLVLLPWARSELYEAYRGWKRANVDRSVRGQFRDTSHVARMAMRVCEDRRFLEYMTTGVNKPKKQDFKAALEFFQPQMMTTGQSDKVVGFLFESVQNFDRLESRFRDWFGVDPAPGLLEIAKKWYKE